MLDGQKLGPFQIEKELGSGAMGTVYRARFDHDGKPVTVALKVVALGLLGNKSAMDRFHREAAILKQLKHPHIVRLIATPSPNKPSKTPFIAMEYIEGESLDHVLARRGKLGWEEVVDYAKQLCSALQYAHEKGIIHRDLKPSNLMVTTDGKLKLTDFGIAKDTDVTALTGANSTIGTAAYMSPEQCRGEKDLSNKSDLYSLGIVLFELLTGRKPFVAENTVDMFMKHVQEPPPRPSKFVPDIPVWLDNLIMFLLEKDKSTRPMDAATVGRMLSDIEFKMQNQQSAGAELANAKKKDRLSGLQKIDDEDLDAARSLKAGKAGKRKKKKSVPLLERQWVRAVPAVVVGIGLIAGAVWFFSPPGQQAMADAVAKSADNESKIAAAEAYLAKYAGQTDEITASVKKTLRETRGKKIEALLDKRYFSSLFDKSKPPDNTDEPTFHAAMNALDAEQSGDLAIAQKQWLGIKGRESEIRDVHGEGWGWLAEERLKLHRDVDDRIKKMREELKDMEINEKPWKFDPIEPESIAKLAIRLGSSGGVPLLSDDPDRNRLKHIEDLPKARRLFAEIVKLTEKKADQRGWFLLAIRERGAKFDPKTDDGKARIELVRKQLDAIRVEWDRVKESSDAGAEKRDIRNRLRELIDGYGDESDAAIKKSLDESKALLSEVK
ncbi:MAG: serine/threonine protein kinase [Planctomycetia bacterium]|nr:serine/threonine protein kinase [Planctomycetia bacterium]